MIATFTNNEVFIVHYEHIWADKRLNIKFGFLLKWGLVLLESSDWPSRAAWTVNGISLLAIPIINISPLLECSPCSS
jgi:hypothetical protein